MHPPVGVEPNRTCVVFGVSGQVFRRFQRFRTIGEIGEDETTDDDRHGIDGREPNRELRGEGAARKSHCQVSHWSWPASMYPIPRIVWISAIAPASSSLRRRRWTCTWITFDSG